MYWTFWHSQSVLIFDNFSRYVHNSTSCESFQFLISVSKSHSYETVWGKNKKQKTCTPFFSIENGLPDCLLILYSEKWWKRSVPSHCLFLLFLWNPGLHWHSRDVFVWLQYASSPQGFTLASHVYSVTPKHKQNV